MKYAMVEGDEQRRRREQLPGSKKSAGRLGKEWGQWCSAGRLACEEGGARAWAKVCGRECPGGSMVAWCCSLEE